MKKNFLWIAIAVMGLTACKQNHQETADKVTATSLNSEYQKCVYEGTIPTADGPGSRYRLSLNMNPRDTTFVLDQNYPDAETSGNDKTFTTRGRLQTIRQDGKLAYRLRPETGEPDYFFLIVNDSTLRLVNSDLQEAASGLVYDLSRQH